MDGYEDYLSDLRNADAALRYDEYPEGKKGDNEFSWDKFDQAKKGLYNLYKKDLENHAKWQI